MSTYIKDIVMKNLALSIGVAALLLSGCDTKQEQKQTQTQKELEKVEQQIAQKVQESEQKAQEAVKEVEKVVEQAATSVNETVEKVTETIVDESEAPVEAVKETVEQTKEAVAAAVAPKDAGKSGKELFVPCIACHGADAKRPAMNASQVIAGWEVEKTVTALKGYKDGSYGGNMKALMVGQVAKLSDEDIQKLAEYINTL
jgi:cytochrome c553